MVAEEAQKRWVRPPNHTIDFVLVLHLCVRPDVVELEKVEWREPDSRQRWHFDTPMDVRSEMLPTNTVDALGDLDLRHALNNNLVITLVQLVADGISDLLRRA